MTAATPPAWARLLAAFLRAVPPVRGRGRIESIAHRLIRNRGWRDTVRVQGFDMALSLDDLIGRTIYLDGVFDRQNTEAVRLLLPRGATVFDVGANIGFYTLLFSSLVGEGGAVFAFEPVPSTGELLKGNLSLNPSLARAVTVHAVALSDTEGNVTMNFSGPSNMGASHVATVRDADAPGRAAAGVAETAVVRCRTADAVWEEAGRPPVAMVKIDVEGHELHAFRGMRELLSQSPAPVVLAEVRDSFLQAAGESRDALFAFLYSLGYRAFDYDARNGRFLADDRPRDAELAIFSKDALETRGPGKRP